MQVYFSNESCDEDQAVVSILLQTSSFSTELKTSVKFHLWNLWVSTCRKNETMKKNIYTCLTNSKLCQSVIKVLYQLYTIR